MAFKTLPNVIIIFPFPGIMALPTQVLWGVVVMPFLLLISCGFFLWQPTVIRSFSKILFLVFLFTVQAGTRVDDYWAEDFDSGKNCEQEEKMIKLLSEVGARSHWWAETIWTFCRQITKIKQIELLRPNAQENRFYKCSHIRISQYGQFVQDRCSCIQCERWEMKTTRRRLSEPASKNCLNRLVSLRQSDNKDGNKSR